ncbi:MAG: hypothetical protein DRI69_10690 [Bacteroidetes bacterium]|nr:MAG: hypothetical protein DRI69_10690 [Bacteroidota bacterium]
MKIWRRLKTEADLDEAQARLEELMDIGEDDPQIHEHLALTYLIEEYEDGHYPIAASTPQRVIQFMMDMKGLHQRDLIPILGSPGQVSKILSGARQMTPEKIVALSDFLGCPVESLLPPGKSVSSSWEIGDISVQLVT